MLKWTLILVGMVGIAESWRVAQRLPQIQKAFGCEVAYVAAALGILALICSVMLLFVSLVLFIDGRKENSDTTTGKGL